MKLLTAKEYKELQAKESKDRAGFQTPLPISVKKEQEDVKCFVLFHPDSTTNHKVNVDYVIDFDGEMVTVPIIESIVRTFEERIKDYMIKAGFLLIRTEILK